MTPRRHHYGDALDYTIKHFGLDTPEFWAELAGSDADADVSMMVYALRTAAGLTQTGLARHVGTTASAISRLENAEYTGHSLAMLRRIAEAVGMKVVVRFAPADANPRPGWLLDKRQHETIRKALVADRARPTQRQARRRSRPARRSARKAG
jgi:transcriptional regulator with XRE-family HTH domain